MVELKCKKERAKKIPRDRKHLPKKFRCPCEAERMDNMSDKRRTQWFILEILKKHSDLKNGISVSEIMKLLKSEFNWEVDRKTVKRNLTLLMSYGLADICENNKKLWRAEWLFSEREKEMLAESIAINPNIPRSEGNEILKKLASQVGDFGVYQKVVFAGRGRVNHNSCKENLSVVLKAIKDRKMLSFSVIIYQKGGKIRLKRDDRGQVIEYLVNPETVISTGGSFKLLGAIGDSGRYLYFPIDKMYDLTVTDITGRSALVSYESYLPLYKVESDRPYFDKKERIIFVAGQNALEKVYESFGEDAEAIRDYRGKVEMQVYCEAEAFKSFALGLCDDIEVIYPKALRKNIAENLRKAYESYLSDKSVFLG